LHTLQQPALVGSPFPDVQARAGSTHSRRREAGDLAAYLGLHVLLVEDDWHSGLDERGGVSSDMSLHQ
jgi:hypothetical protein